MESETNKIYGRLDNALDGLSFTAETIKKNWDKGTTRMRKGEIERAKKYTKEIAIKVKQINEYIKAFGSIVFDENRSS